ncbi:MAG: arsenical efflux pump membrane protein ArsB [Coleofasciculus sp. S288]|nr:arsenical efflux pump membrane protein ArsB [Coleofasciculus sp. S288]
MQASLVAIAIFLLTLILVIWQPRGLGIGFSALGGALLALATGVVTLQDVSATWGIIWDATFTLIALSLIFLILDEAGFFQWLALLVARLGVGIGRLLFPLVILLGVLVTILLTNNGTALFWTPTVMEMMLMLSFRPKAALAFVFATGFIADAASAALPASHLVNTISADYFQISWLRYILVMIPVNFMAIAISLGVLWFYFERYIPPTYNLVRLPPRCAIGDPIVCQWGFAIFGLLIIGYFFAPRVGVPVSFYAAISALIMLALAGRWFHNDTTVVISLRKVLREAPWQVIFFSLGMYFVVFGLRDVAIDSLLNPVLQELSDWGLTLAATGTGFLAALLSSILNNIPTVLLTTQAIQDITAVNPVVREVMVYANAMGCNLGAKITPLGSLSTLLWLYVLARKGLYISWGQYVRIAFVLTIPVLFLSLLSLAIWLPWLIA